MSVTVALNLMYHILVRVRKVDIIQNKYIEQVRDDHYILTTSII